MGIHIFKINPPKTKTQWSLTSFLLIYISSHQLSTINYQLSIHHHQQSFIPSFTDFPDYQTTPSSFSPFSCSSIPSVQSPLSSLCTGSTSPSSNSHPHAELIKNYRFQHLLVPRKYVLAQELRLLKYLLAKNTHVPPLWLRFLVETHTRQAF